MLWGASAWFFCCEYWTNFNPILKGKGPKILEHSLEWSYVSVKAIEA